VVVIGSGGFWLERRWRGALFVFFFVLLFFSSSQRGEMKMKTKKKRKIP
jgi:hypothetical protein